MLILLGLLAGGVALELACRAIFSAEEIAGRVGPENPGVSAWWVDHPFLPFVGRSGVDYAMSTEEGGRPLLLRVRNNEYGFRAHELPDSPKAPEDYVIVALGGSTTWGAHAPTNAETWPELLEAKLGESYPARNVKVFNLGTSMGTSVYSVVALALIGVHLDPDLVIVYHGYNDEGPATSEGFRRDHSHFYSDLNLASRSFGFQAALPRWLLGSWAVVWASRLIDDALGAQSLASYVTDGGRFDQDLSASEEVVARLKENWRTLEVIDAMARGRDARTLFSTFQFRDPDRHREVNESLRALFADKRLDFVDQDALIPDHDPSLQYDVCHFTAKGRDLLAENFHRAIKERAWIAPTAPTP